MRSRVIALTLPLAFSLFGSSAILLAAQDPQDTSVADAARRAQAQKKSAANPAKVITNETLPAAPKQDSTTTAGTPPTPSPDVSAQPATSTEAASSDAGTQPAPASDTAAASTATTDAKAAATEADKAKKNPEVASLKQQIADQQKEVELLMRLYALDQDTFLSNPEHAKDPQGKAKLDAQQEEIHAKVAEAARLKEKLEAIAPGESAKVVTPKP